MIEKNFLSENFTQRSCKSFFVTLPENSIALKLNQFYLINLKFNKALPHKSATQECLIEFHCPGQNKKLIQ